MKTLYGNIRQHYATGMYYCTIKHPKNEVTQWAKFPKLAMKKAINYLNMCKYLDFNEVICSLDNGKELRLSHDRSKKILFHFTEVK